MVRIALKQNGDPAELPEDELATNMRHAASTAFSAALQPTYFIDVPMVNLPSDRPADLRTKEGRAWRAAQEQGAMA